MSNWKHYLDDNQDRFLQDLIDFVGIPSISSSQEHFSDVVRAAEWVANRLTKSGIDNVEILPTGNHPIVYGEHLETNEMPTVLIYGHFDVQPVDPIELWDHPPFEPHLSNGRLYGRGATDDKGSMLIPILAVEALLATEEVLPVNLKFLFEGQEEIGSPDLLNFLTAQRERLACDLVISADGMQWDVNNPAIWVGLKGLCSLEIDVRGANQDLHSGIHGGMVQNPIHVLADLIASLRNSEGKITIEGFYDSVLDLTEGDRKRMALVPFSAEDEAKRLGINSLVSEPGYTPQEHAWARPTVEVNGIWGGYQGDGTKTVLPNTAHAKITCRLVPNQNPIETIEAIQQHLESRVPPGVTVSVKPGREGASPYRISTNHPGNEIAHTVLEEVYGKEPYYVWTGGTIPFCALMLQQLGVYTVNFGFQLEDEQLHAPNEFMRLANFHRGQNAYIRLLQTIGEKGLSVK